MSDKLIIEVRANEYTDRAANPNLPWTADEIARDGEECRQAGASILHFHARNADGSPDNRFESTRDAILAARARSDMLILPTLGYVTLDAPAEERVANVVRLARDPRTKPEFAPIDMGSTNVDLYDPVKKEFRSKGLIYRNGIDTLEHLARTITGLGITPYLTSWNISFSRTIGAFLDMGLLREPAFVGLVMTSDVMLSGHPATPAGLDAHTRFLPSGWTIAWSAMSYNGNILDLADKIILEGGHFSIGLGDWPHLELGRPSNADLVRIVAERARALGREVATPEEARAILGVTVRPPR